MRERQRLACLRAPAHRMHHSGAQCTRVDYSFQPEYAPLL
nr:MAG TPA: peptidyl-prolyl cis-transisomerase [Caudoviricetes sp.]